MIVKMSKVYIASGSDDRDRLLGALRDLAVMHLIPIDADSAIADEKTIHQLDAMGRAIQVLSAEHPTAAAPDVSCSEAAGETLNIHRGSIERQNRLATLHRQVEQLAIWGDVRLEDIEALRQAGVEPDFYSVPTEDLPDIRAELVHPITELPDKRLLVAVVQRGEEPPQLPDSAEIIEMPTRDRPTIRSEAAEIDAALKADVERLRELANLLPAMRTEHNALRGRAQYIIAQRGGLHEGQLFAMQGWVPADQVEALGRQLAAAGVVCAVQPLEPAEDEEPPSLVRYPRWARPIKALFDILGTTPGYRESDLSPFFMIALPLFAAMLIGDAGYGLIFTLTGLLCYGKIAHSQAGKPAAQMLVFFGVVCLGWGAIAGNWFGVSPQGMVGAGSVWAALGSVLQPLAILWRENPDESRDLIIKLSFIFGSIHLVLAHLRAALAVAPHLKVLAELGWALFLAGMLGIVWMLFFPNEIWMPSSVMSGLLLGGAVLFVLFSHPSKNPLKMVGLGIADNILGVIGAFSDTMSYIRLMAVGLASYYIASAFNNLGMDIAAGSMILWIPAAVIIILAHALNIALGIIAVFAHGVRLNMLEFSSNAGVQWAGYPYAPFAIERISN